MTRDKLESLTEEQLLVFARKEGIHNHNSISRDELIGLILEALEEDKVERRETNNYAMLLKHKKYDILKDEEIEVLQQEDFTLPGTYNDTRIVLLIRDPEWAYVYWDINGDKMEELKNEPNYEGFFFRVYECRGENLGKEAVVDYFDVSIEEEDDSRFISLNKPGSDYCVELFASVLHKEVSLAVSNSVHSPLGYIARNKEEFYSNPDTMMLMLSGLWDFEARESEVEPIPQRIISILDSHDFEVSTDR